MRSHGPGALARTSAVEMALGEGITDRSSWAATAGARANWSSPPVAAGAPAGRSYHAAETGGLALMPGSPPMHGGFLPGRLMRRAAELVDDAQSGFRPTKSPGRSMRATVTGERGHAGATRRDPQVAGGHPARPTAVPAPAGRGSGVRPAGPTERPDDRVAPTVRRATVAPPGTTALGRRYLGALSRRRADRDEPLPVQLRPLAQLVVGDRRAASVRLRTGPATSEALAEVGRAAATVGNVIHLPSPPTQSVRSAEVVAHELVHAVRPSPVPRFFQDDHDTAEERQAMFTGGVVRDLAAKTLERGGIATALQRRVEGSRSHRASHLLFGTAGLTVAPGASPLTAGTMAEVAASGRGSSLAATSSPATAARAAGPVTGRAAGPAAGPTGSSGSSQSASPAPGADGASTIHRRRAAGRHRLEPPDATLPPGLARLLDRPDTFSLPGVGPDPRAGEVPFTDGFQGSNPPPSTRPGGPMSASYTPTPLVETSSHPISQETLDWIVEAVEDRILNELERRGLRFQPGVF